MLQQILRDLYVDPEILLELDDNQKQTLFCKMREEQVRRWKVWDQKIDKQETVKRETKKKVTFLNGIDGEPWVWVMGDHENDRSIEEILKEEAIEQARNMAEKETEELRRQVEAQFLAEYTELTPKIVNLQPPSDSEVDITIYCSVDELRKKVTDKSEKANYYTFNYYNNKCNENNPEGTDVLQEISINTQKVAQRVALWEKKLTEKRTCEIFQKIQKKHEEVAREAEEEDKRKEQLWREQGMFFFKITLMDDMLLGNELYH